MTVDDGVEAYFVMPQHITHRKYWDQQDWAQLLAPGLVEETQIAAFFRSISWPFVG